MKPEQGASGVPSIISSLTSLREEEKQMQYKSNYKEVISHASWDTVVTHYVYTIEGLNYSIF